MTDTASKIVLEADDSTATLVNDLSFDSDPNMASLSEHRSRMNSTCETQPKSGSLRERSRSTVTELMDSPTTMSQSYATISSRKKRRSLFTFGKKTTSNSEKFGSSNSSIQRRSRTQSSSASSSTSLEQSSTLQSARNSIRKMSIVDDDTFISQSSNKKLTGGFFKSKRNRSSSNATVESSAVQMLVDRLKNKVSLSSRAGNLPLAYDSDSGSKILYDFYEGPLKMFREGKYEQCWGTVKETILSVSSKSDSRPFVEIDLDFATIQKTSDPFGFQLISRDKNYKFSACSEEERSGWKTLIEEIKLKKQVIENALGQRFSPAYIKERNCSEFRYVAIAEVQETNPKDLASFHSLPESEQILLNSVKQYTKVFRITRKLSIMDALETVNILNQVSYQSVLIPTADESSEVTTIDKIIEFLVDESSEIEEFVDIFLLTFRHVISPRELLIRLITEFNATLKENPSAEEIDEFVNYKSVIGLRILSFVAKWSTVYCSDFTHEEERNLLEGLILLVSYPEIRHSGDRNFLKIYSTEFTQFGKFLRDIIRRHDERNSKIAPEIAEAPQNEKIHPDMSEFDFKEMSLCLALKHHAQFTAIDSYELAVQLWENSNSPTFSKRIENLNTMISYFNKVSYWVATEICTQPDIKKRQKIMETFIKIAKESKKICNFDLLMAIISGLNNSAVSRLKATWEGVQAKYTTILKELETFASPEHNYRTYRNTLEALLKNEKSETGVIPFFVLYIKDLTFINDGNPTKLEGDRINFRKLHDVYNKVKEIQTLQSKSYKPGKISQEVRVFIDKMRFIKDEALYKYSCLCENKRGDNTVRLIDKWAKGKK